MTLDKKEAQQQVSLFYKMLEAFHSLSHWIYDAEGELLRTNCEDMVINTIFETTGCKESMMNHAKENSLPLMLSANLGLLWVVAFERYDNRLYRMHVLGPAFHTEISVKRIRDELEKYQVPFSWKHEFSQILSNLPVISATAMRRAVIMLHFCVSDEKISSNDVIYQAEEIPVTQTQNSADLQRIWMAEQKLFHMVREGDLNYHSALEESGNLSPGVNLCADTPIVQAQVTIIVFTSLCTRAAIDGGILPDIAYTVGDNYIQQVYDCDRISQLANISHEMYDTFIRMVHEHKRRTDLSKHIHACVDFINLHLEEDLTLSQIANRVGYAEYYLSKKFRREMGISVNEYIRKARIERACLLLTTTQDSLQDIADRLHFSTRNYFSVVFREVMGETPTEYRERNRQV